MAINKTHVLTNRLADEQNRMQTMPTKQQSKSSMNKTMKTKDAHAIHPNAGITKHQPISVWD
jgi:hypothetical protein